MSTASVASETRCRVFKEKLLARK